MSNQEKLKIFIGSGEASLLERKTLIYSLRKHSTKPLDIYVFNGTKNCLEFDGQEQALPAEIPEYRSFNKWATEFSLYRYLIPELCRYQGKALYLDSDTVCLTDIGRLFETNLEEWDFAVKREQTPKGQSCWATSVLLINCESCRFDLKKIFSEIKQNAYSYLDFTTLRTPFLDFHPLQIKELDPHWNEFDRQTAVTHLVHYTDLNTQPWRFTHHPSGEVWFNYFNEAINDGFISREEIEYCLQQKFVRSDILKGNRGDNTLKVRLRARLNKNLLRVRYFVRHYLQKWGTT